MPETPEEVRQCYISIASGDSFAQRQMIEDMQVLVDLASRSDRRNTAVMTQIPDSTKDSLAWCSCTSHVEHPLIISGIVCMLGPNTNSANCYCCQHHCSRLFILEENCSLHGSKY